MNAPAESMAPGRIWSLWDMLTEKAEDFVSLGEVIDSLRTLYIFNNAKHPITGEAILNEEEQEQVKYCLNDMLEVAERLNLTLSIKQIGRFLEYENLPATTREYHNLTELLKDEMSNNLLLLVPSDRAKLWESDGHLSALGNSAFPNSAAELRYAGNAYVAGLHTGSVFYSMRAVEYGLRALAADVGLTFDVQQWQNIIDQIQSKIEDMRKVGIPGVGKAEKNERLQFLSEAAKEFAYFKDGWRNYVSHTKVPYGEHQALTVLNHVSDFINRLSRSLTEH